MGWEFEWGYSGVFFTALIWICLKHVNPLIFRNIGEIIGILLGTWWNISATFWYLGVSENWVLFSQHCNLNDENDNQTNPFGKWFDRKQKEWDHNYMTLRVLFLSSLNLSYRLMKRVNWVNWCDDMLSAFLTRNGSVSKPCTPGEHQNSW